MLEFNTFRSQRYLRTKFVDGRFLLSSEGTDLESEMLDLSRTTIKNAVGDVFVGNSLLLQYNSTSQILVNNGEAWYQGLPFIMRSSKDEVWSIGIAPSGVSLIADPSSQGYLLQFTTGVTPSGTYQIVVTAEEQLITNIQDPFLQNVNLTEATSQKLRLVYLVNVVTAANQTQTPIPYTPETGAFSVANLTNSVVVSPTPGGNGELLATNPVSGTNIDGRSLELTVRNNPGLGGGNPLPVNSTDQATFTNGSLIDSNGTRYWLNAIFLDPSTSNNVILRIDQEVGQADPVLTNGMTYTVNKRDVYAQDNSTGSPIGKLFLPLGTALWSSIVGLAHPTKVVDTRNKVIEADIFQQTANERLSLQLTGGGSLSYSNNIAAWSQAFTIINPAGPNQVIAVGSVALVEDGSAVYQLNPSGGVISLGTLAVNVSSNSGATVNLSPVSLLAVQLGNVLQVGSEVVTITAIDQPANQLTVSPNLVGTGAGTIYYDSYGPSAAHIDENSFVLFSRHNNQVWFETSIAVPVYSSDIRGTAGESVISRAGVLTDAVGDEQEDRAAQLYSTNVMSWNGSLLTFTSDLILKIYNPKNGGGGYEETILASNSPITINDGESIYINLNRTTNTNTVPIRSSITPVPAQTQATKDVIILFHRIGSDLLIPIHKQLISSGLSFKIGTTPSAATVRAYPNFFLSPAGNGDGTTFAAALSALPASGGVICLMDDITISSNISFPKNVKLLGRNANASVIIATGGCIQFNGDYCKIEDVNFKSDGTSTGQIYVKAYTERYEIHNCSFVSTLSTDAQFYIDVAAPDGVIRNPTFSGTLNGGTNTGINFQPVFSAGTVVENPVFLD